MFIISPKYALQSELKPEEKATNLFQEKMLKNQILK